jgi:hypothetical protein
MTAAAWLVALLSERRRRLIQSFRALHATGPETAQRVSSLDPVDQQQFAELLAAGVIRAAAPDRYYLDEVTLSEYNAFWSRRGFWITIIVLGVVVVGMLAIAWAATTD